MARPYKHSPLLAAPFICGFRWSCQHRMFELFPHQSLCPLCLCGECTCDYLAQCQMPVMSSNQRSGAAVPPSKDAVSLQRATQWLAPTNIRLCWRLLSFAGFDGPTNTECLNFFPINLCALCASVVKETGDKLALNQMPVTSTNQRSGAARPPSKDAFSLRRATQWLAPTNIRLCRQTRSFAGFDGPANTECLNFSPINLCASVPLWRSYL